VGDRYPHHFKLEPLPQTKTLIITLHHYFGLNELPTIRQGSGCTVNFLNLIGGVVVEPDQHGG
jgi:hypothetical protein